MEKKQNRVSAETISVIVPVYKVEPYLPACIDSILAQTHGDFQLILVDDGSPDRCGQICDEYAARDSRILVIHQENAGVSAARNAGLDWVFANSESQWINFVDSDDLVSPVYLETLYHYAVEHDADITVTGGSYFTDERELEAVSDAILSVRSATGAECCRELLSGEHFFLNVLWGKLIRRHLFTDLRCPVGKIHEDEAVAPILLYSAQKVTFARSWLYWYRQRTGSIMHSGFSREKFAFLEIYDECIGFFESNNETELAKMAAMYRNRCLSDLILLARKEKKMDEVPSQYRMPVWNVYFIAAKDTMRRGGVKFVAQRFGNLLRQHFGNR